MKKIIIFSLACFIACNSQAQNLKDPVYNFDYFWQDYKSNYKMFAVKHINWDSLYQVYRPMIDHNSSDEKLFSVISQLMYHLDDSHCWLDNGTMFYKSGTNVTYPHTSWSDEYWKKYHIGNFSLSLIESSYVTSKKFKTQQEGNFQYGWLKDSIGYFHFGEFKETLKLNAIMDTILKEFQSAKGLVIDIRSNGGGQASVPLILSRFADQRRLYVVNDSNAFYLFKGDEKYNKKSYLHMEPRGQYRFTKPIVVLTAGTTYSSADLLASGFKEMPQSTLIGDTTNGCTSNMYMLALPNGWHYTITMGIAYTAAGICLDGIGIAPDIYIVNSEKDIKRGNDRMLERGIEEINRKTFYRAKEVDYSLLNALPPQISEIFINLLEEDKTAEAFSYLNIMYDQYPDICERTICEECISEIAWEFAEIKRYDIAIEIFKLNNKIFPYSPNTLFNLGEVYEIIEDNITALYYYEEVKKMDPNFKSNFYMLIDESIADVK